MLGAEADIGVGREMQDEIRATHGGGHRREIGRVAFDQRKAGMSDRARQEVPPAGREIVVDHDLGAARQEVIGRRTADETGPAGDEHAVRDHAVFLPVTRHRMPKGR